MNYSIWTDGDNRKIPLEEMSDKYIKNCMKDINQLLPRYQGKVELIPEQIDSPFTASWLVTHGENYLDAFEQELEIRRRIAREEYPTVYLPKECRTCDKRLLCEYKQDSPVACEEWEPANIAIQSALSSEIDREIAYRTHAVIVKEA